ncbi:palmitoyl-acyl carrier protein thioesterase, chloroplastic-like [Pistacia vera]|uniref:palmitoyl-acyl carrier protein thioesterase, chloroplastic-like n=1 Tax=Pistacia vera TaxID=55513 RepID=UPI001263281F|nr:palmitoyl-acyl carrier protein thioesterase, chloroplastic-like [Pistacia vera]
MIIKLTLPTTTSQVALPFCKLNFTPASGLEKKRLNQPRFMINFGKSSLSPISPPLEIINQISAATKGKLETVNGKPGIVESARLLKDGLIFQQNFTIRSFEIGSDFRISIQALMNYLQETSINHLKSLGIVTDTFGSTLNMAAENLIWVVCWSHVEVDYYPSWGDVVQVEAWMYRSGRNGFRRDWLIRDLKTGKTLIRATSLYAMMNKKTRKFAKLNEEVITADLKPFFTHCDPLINKDSRKFLHLDTDNADYSRTGLNPGWMDMDANQHVSHIKLVNYVLEGVPRSFVESHELCVMTLEYRKECNVDSVLQSLSKISGNDQLIDNQEIEFDHSLRLECGPELVRGRTRWRKKFCGKDKVSE